MQTFMRHSFIVTFCCMVSIVLAQNEQAIDSLFYRGVQSYEQKNYDTALETLEFLDRVYGLHHRHSGSLLMQAKSLEKKNELQRAEEVYTELMADFPESAYFDDALFGLAKVYYKNDKHVIAVQKLLDILDHDADERLTRKSVVLSSEIMTSQMDLEDMRNLVNLVHGERGRSAVVLKLADMEIEENHYRAAQKILIDYMDQYPSSANLFQVQQMLNRVETLGKECIRVGVILPLSGPLDEAGKQLLAGIHYAKENHNKTQSTRIELVIKDSGGRVLKAVLAAQELCEKEKVVAIIGELSSNITAAVAGIAQENNVVLMAPTSSETGITAIGDFIFQFNSTFSLRGAALAEYAINGLGMRRFAILYPVDVYGQTMRKSFLDKVNELEGEILIEKYYFSGSESLKPQFEAIREKGIQQMIEDSTLQLIPKEDLEELIPKIGVTYLSQTVEDLIDSTELAVQSIDGIFLPVYYEDLQNIIPQYAQYNLNARVFGGSPWNDKDVWEQHSRFIDTSVFDGAVFSSDYYVAPSNSSYKQFQNEFRIAIGRTPTKLTVFGFDVLNLIASYIKIDIPDSKKLRDELINLGSYQGLRGPITFNAQRVNPEMFLLQYKTGVISLIK